MKILCLDAEFANVEMLELSVWEISGWPTGSARRQVFHQYFKPEHETRWPGAQRVNHISPEMVASKPHFSKWRPELQALFDSADLLVGFAIDNDIEKLVSSGIKGLEEKPIIDVIDFHWMLNSDPKEVSLYSRKGLDATAPALGVEFSENLAHGADYDTRVTADCFMKLTEAFACEGEEAEQLLTRYNEEWGRARYEFERDFAHGWVSLVKVNGGYSLKVNKEEPRQSPKTEAVIEVSARRRAVNEIDSRFSKRRVMGMSGVYALKPSDIEWFKLYKNEFDSQESFHKKAYELRLSLCR